MNALTVDQFMRLSTDDRDAIKAWLSLHGLDADCTFLLQWDARRIRVQQYRLNAECQFHLDKRNHVATRTRTVSKRAAFPVARPTHAPTCEGACNPQRGRVPCCTSQVVSVPAR